MGDTMHLSGLFGTTAGGLDQFTVQLPAQQLFIIVDQLPSADWTG